jgi:group I intron endonuclease
MIGIYIIKNVLNNKVYIGSSLNIQKRWKYHIYYLKIKKHHSILLQRAWDLDGEEKFLFEILEALEDKTLLLQREQYYLDLYKSYIPEYGYNLCSIANSMLGYKYSDEQKLKMSENRRGEKNQHYGKKHSEETKKKISEKNKNRYISEEEKQKRSVAMKKAMKRIKEEEPEKYEKMLSIKYAAKGKKRSEETRRKISEASKKRIGLKNHRSKLNYEIANQIREDYKTKLFSFVSLGKKYGVSKTTIKDIVTDKRWIE